MNKDRLLEYADVFAFLGNSLLKPMSQTQDIGLDPEFWLAFPKFDSDRVAEYIGRCVEFADGAHVATSMGKDMVEEVSVEYTKLFIGPPAPAAPPWETMNREEGVSVGFGQPTIDMQIILRDMGLEVNNANNQYADHIGLELLTLSEMCRRAAAQSDVVDETIEIKPLFVDAAKDANADARKDTDEESETSLDVVSAKDGRDIEIGDICAFIVEHPLGWISNLHDKVYDRFENGYYVGILALAKALMEEFVQSS